MPVSEIWKHGVKEDFFREHGQLNLSGKIAFADSTIDLLAFLILKNATFVQRRDPQVLVQCAREVFEEFGWIDAFNQSAFKSEAFRRQFERIQNTQGLFPPDEEGRAMRKAKQAWVEGNKNKRFVK